MEYVCPGGKVTIKNNKYACDCQDGYELDDKTNRCNLKPICSENGSGWKECSKRNAICTIDSSDLTKPKCQCPENTDWWPISDNSSSSKCVDFCQIGNRRQQCDKINADCVPTKHPGAYDLSFCQCRPGTTLQGDQCVVSSISYQFSLELQSYFDLDNMTVPIFSGNDVDYTKMSPVLRQFINEKDKTQQANKAIIDKAMEEYKKKFIEERNLNLTKMILSGIYKDLDSLAIVNCSSNKDNHNCVYTININAKETGLNLPNEIRKKCKDIPNEPDMCFIPTLSEKPEHNNLVTDYSLYDIQYWDTKSSLKISKKMKEPVKRNVSNFHNYRLSQKILYRSVSGVHSMHNSIHSLTNDMGQEQTWPRGL